MVNMGPLVPESIGPIDQFVLNVFSIANALVFGFLSLKTPCVWFLASINHLVSISGCKYVSTISLCLVGEMV